MPPSNKPTWIECGPRLTDRRNMMQKNFRRPGPEYNDCKHHLKGPHEAQSHTDYIKHRTDRIIFYQCRQDTDTQKMEKNKQDQTVDCKTLTLTFIEELWHQMTINCFETCDRISDDFVNLIIIHILEPCYSIIIKSCTLQDTGASTWRLELEKTLPAVCARYMGIESNANPFVQLYGKMKQSFWMKDNKKSWPDICACKNIIAGTKARMQQWSGVIHKDKPDWIVPPREQLNWNFIARKMSKKNLEEYLPDITRIMQKLTCLTKKVTWKIPAEQMSFTHKKTLLHCLKKMCRTLLLLNGCYEYIENEYKDIMLFVTQGTAKLHLKLVNTPDHETKQTCIDKINHYKTFYTDKQKRKMCLYINDDIDPSKKWKDTWNSNNGTRDITDEKLTMMAQDLIQNIKWLHLELFTCTQALAITFDQYDKVTQQKE